MGHSGLYHRSRRFIREVVLFLCCCTTIAPAFAQRLRDRVVWARERYAVSFDGIDKLSTFNATLKEWDIHDTLGLAAPVNNAQQGIRKLERLPGSPNYDVNYENVIFLGAGVFTNTPDTTYSRLEQRITPIPSAVIVQNGRMGHGGAFSASKRVLQVFTIESRPFVVRDPTDADARNSWAYRTRNREGLGFRYIPQARFPGSANPSPVIDPSKINVMVGGAAVVHPYILRYNDATTDPSTIRAVVVANVSGDARDEIVLYRETSSGMEVVVLETPLTPDPQLPLDYMLQPRVAATIPPSVIDPQTLRSVVAGDINGDGRTDLVHVVGASSGKPQRFIVATPANGWSFTERGTPSTSTTDFSTIHSVHSARLGLGGSIRHSIAIVNANTTDHVLTTFTAATLNGPLNADAATVTIDAADAAPSRLHAAAAGDLDADGIDDIILASTRLANGVSTSVLTRLYRTSQWTSERLARFATSDLDATMMRRMVVANLDYDIRQRADIGILYHGNPSSTPRDDLFLLWSSLPPHTINDYAITADTGNTTKAFLPHGWWNIRLVSDLVRPGSSAPLYMTDYWAKTDYWRPPSALFRMRGLVFTPDSGKISTTELQRYASIYNCLVPERQQYSDLFHYGRAGTVADDNKTQFYFYNATEVRRGLGLYLTTAAIPHNLYVLPYLGMHDVHSYDQVSSTPLRVRWHDWSSTASTSTLTDLPGFYRVMLDPAIHAQRPFLGWMTADEPSGLLRHTESNFHPRFTDTALVNAATRSDRMHRTMRDHYLSIRRRMNAKPVFQIYHYVDDFEYYRNCHDVAMMDFYPYTYTYSMRTLLNSSGDTVKAPNGTPVRQRDRTLPDQSAISLQYSWTPLLRRQIDHVIRCDKDAAIHVAQGVGENSVVADFDPRDTMLLRTLPRFRTMTLAQARHQLWAPAVMGLRGAFWWDGYTWMGGGTVTDVTSNDPSFLRHDPVASNNTPQRNQFGSLIHHALNNHATSSLLRATIDTASAEFRAFIPIFLSESLRGKVSITGSLPPEGVYDHDIVTALHIDPATRQRWLFVSNLSPRTASRLSVQVDDIADNMIVYTIKDGPVRKDRLVEVNADHADSVVVFSATVPAFGTSVFTFVPKEKPSGGCIFWPF